jgi:endonuclease/exonuclease/phosphatase family metal-dependent hydrolase
MPTLLRRRWLLFIVILLAILATWVSNASTAGRRPVGCPQACATRTTRPEVPLRVISFNVLHGFPRFEDLEERLHLAAEEIVRQEADLVLLQEVPWTFRVRDGARLLARQTGFNYLYLRAQGNRRAILFDDGVAILSRFPLENPASVELLPREGFFEPRVALYAVAVTPFGRLPLVVTHLAGSDPAVNRGQAAALQEFVASQTAGPAIVAGDFNATPDSPQITSLTREWIDAYAAAHPGEPGLTCCIDDLRAPPSEPLEERIDYVFFLPGNDLRVVYAQRVFDRPFPFADGWLWASDHVGLLAVIGTP